MKKATLILSAVLTITAVMASCNKKTGCTNQDALNYDAIAEEDDGSCIFTNEGSGIVSNPGTGVTFDGYTYSSVVLGNGQEWMVENLRTNKFCNGDSIPNVNDYSDWEGLTSAAWAYYDNDSQYDFPYGKLYNWYAVDDMRNICPCGWHVPTDAEWNTLIEYLDPNSELNALGIQSTTAGGKMKSAGTQYWISPNQDATNVSGFSGLPGGGHASSGIFATIGRFGCWWSSSELSISTAWYRLLNSNDGHSSKDNRNKTYGFSVRCMRD